MISKKEFIKKFKEEYNKIVGVGDTEENRKKHFENINLEEAYRIFVSDVNEDTEHDYTEACIGRLINYYYMMYPDY